jgi:Mg-chelatase subunit ChlD
MKHLLTLTVCLGCACALPGRAATPPTAEKSQTKPRIEVCFVLDTTGSMSGLIEGAKQKIWSIANELTRTKPAPEIRIGLIGYRDRGDEYVVKSFDLTTDIDAMYGHLQTFQAAGGGDAPESVNEALQEAVTKMSWSDDKSVLKTIFLVGDAPPHMDYPDGPKYPEVCKAAVKKDLVINTIQCGNMVGTAGFWQDIAHASEGNYAAIAQTGNMVAIATPMDARLAELNRDLGANLVSYGGAAAGRAIRTKQAAAEAAPASVAADRLAFNARYGLAVQGEGELLDSLNSGKVKLETIRKADLPTEWQALDQSELKAAIDKKQAERTQIQAQIQKLAKEREEFLAKEKKRLAESGKADSFDEKVASFIQSQAARKGIHYSE